ncbi:putative disease resistance protein RGA4 [Miscanthus floridulus]|uniref:putative disease resistance protein RGA4 n=1 Tax=Miscanthus floridulus TaxID=154761 RepID=UPI00345768D0
MTAVAAAFAGKAIAISTISYIITKAFDHLKDNKKAGGLKSTQTRLEKLLPQIQVVFDAVDTEQIRDQNEALDAWLWQLRDAVEEAEDALDELEYNKLEEEVKSRDSKVTGSLHKYKGKLVQKFNHTFNTGSLKRLTSAVKTLDEAVADVQRFLPVLNQFDNNKLKKHKQDVDFRNWRETSSLPQSLVLGREKERETIVHWLTKAGSGASERVVSNIPIFSIVGIGGLGKTTLAQVICNDDRVKDYFDLIIWACASYYFDVETLTRKILQDVTRQQINIVGLNVLHNELKEKLSSKTFLLVLDDVWNDDRIDYWESFVRPLRYGKSGSKILLTTRMQSVADLAARAMQEECQSLKLSGLGEADLRDLLNMHAFSGVNPDDYRNLQQISKKMVGNLSGSPLAAKVLGGLLNSKRDSSTWDRMLTSSIHNIEQGKEGIMAVLRLSYQHLPTHLQACFRYCSLLGKDYEFTKEELVHLWMGSGSIQQLMCYDGSSISEEGCSWLAGACRRS